MVNELPEIRIDRRHIGILIILGVGIGVELSLREIG